jgi:glycosyltransferase involved in cell wall biosynthesis
MRLWILNHYAVPSSVGGITRNAALAEHLCRFGNDVTIFASATGHFGGKNRGTEQIARGQYFSEKMIEGVRWRLVRTPAYRNTIQRFANMRAFRANVLRSVGDLPRPDVIIGSCIHPYAVDGAIRLSRKLGVPFVYEIRDIWPESLVDLGVLTRRHPVYWLFRRMELQAFRSAAGVIVLFPGMFDYTSAHGIPPEDVCYVPNGCDPSKFPVPFDFPPDDPFVVSYFGSMGPANGLETVINAADILRRVAGDRSVRFHLVGDGTGREALEQRVKSLKLANVFFHDPVPKGELTSFVRKTHAFVFCTSHRPIIARYGMSPNKLYDYMMFGRPVISACSSYNDPVRDANAGISIPTNDSERLATEILRLRSLGECEWRQMGERGRSYVEANHNFSLLARRLEGFLTWIVNGKPESTPSWNAAMLT